MTVANADQIAFWNTGAGETWARRHQALDAELAPLGRRVMDLLAPAPGERLIDVGCGCGDTSLDLARAVGPGGAVLGVDISAPMLALARERAADAGLAQARFLEGDAQTHAFEAGAADGAFSRFGVMFFENPAAALANIRRGLKRGGRLAFVCWRDVALNPFMTLPYAAAAHLFPPAAAAPDPLAPGPFAFADDARLARLLTEAGYAQVDIAAHDQPLGYGGVEETADLSLAIGPLGSALREHPQLAQAARACVHAALVPHDRPGGVFLDSASWMVTARNP